LGWEERFKFNVQRIAVDEGEVTTCDLFRKLLLKARQKIVVQFDRNHPRTSRQQALCQHAEAGANLQHRLAWRSPTRHNDRVAGLKVNKEALA
jgi:hypothetical protein